MTALTSLFVNAAVEGIVDEAVLRRIFVDTNASLNRIYIAEGKSRLLHRLASYNHAANWQPWIVLIDLDQDASCAPIARQNWLPEQAPNLCFRIAVRAVESWLLADTVALAEYLHVPRSQVPQQPDILNDPKLTMVNLAQQSRRSAIVRDMIPRPGSGRSIGPAYSARMIEFAYSHWRPRVAKDNSDSLQKLFHCIEMLLATEG